MEETGKKKNRMRTRITATTDSMDLENAPSQSTKLSPQKRKIDEVLEIGTSGFEQLLAASAHPALAAPVTTASTTHRENKVDSIISQFYTPEENELLSFMDGIVQAYNIYDMEEFYQILNVKCHPNTTLRLKNFSYTITGVHPILIFCNITHECYPDAMLKILEKRIINLTSPVTSTSTRSNKSSSTAKATPENKELDIKLEYICKFHGTIISNQDIAKICQEFLNSPEIAGATPPIISSTEEADAKTSSVEEANDKSNEGDKNRLNKAALLQGVKMEDLSMGLARFVSSHYTSTDNTDQSSHPASFFIIELIFTLDADQKKILHTEMDILAASEQMTTIQKTEE